MDSDTNDVAELRGQLCAAWEALVRRLVATDHPPALVVETILDVAVSEFASLHGGTAAANYLQLLANQTLVDEKRRANQLIEG